MQVRVDSQRCQGHARCAALAPEVFALDDWGYASAIERIVPAEHEDAARRAYISCPEQAITLTED